MESRKMVQKNLFAMQRESVRCREQIYGYQAEKGGVGRIERLGLTYTHYYI